MPRDPRAANKPYSAPTLRMLDARAAQAELKAKGEPKDANVQRMSSFIDRQLPRQKAKMAMVVFGSIPFAVLLFTSENNNKHYASPDVLSVFGGFWAILAIWIILDKGMDSMMSQDAIGTAWLLLGVSNLIGVILFFSSLSLI